MIRTPLLATLLLATAPALAQPQPRPPVPTGPTVTAETQVAVETCLRGGRAEDPNHARGCLERQRAVLEPRLDRALNSLRTAQRPERRTAFDAVQTAWTTYRDRSCDYAGTNPDAGPGAAADRAACMLEFAVSRVEELEEALRPPTPPPPAPRR